MYIELLLCIYMYIYKHYIHALNYVELFILQTNKGGQFKHEPVGLHKKWMDFCTWIHHPSPPQPFA